MHLVHKAVGQKLHSCLLQHIVSQHLEDFGIIRSYTVRKTDGIPEMPGGASPLHKAGDNLLGQAPNDLLAAGGVKGHPGIDRSRC
ncbi:hypothetical protein D3C73_1369210 [compost metagenome]